jgi:1,2-diacylglycerol 3-alpha-glucosyltransferase
LNLDTAPPSTRYGGAEPALADGRPVRDRLRILFVSDVYFPRVNGVSTSLATFRAALARLGHESVLVCPDYPGASPTDDIVRVAARAVPLDPEDRAMRWSRVGRLDRLLGEREFDLVHIQTPFLAHYAGLRHARARGIPAVATYHTLFEEYLFHYVPFAPRSAMRALARRFSRSQCNELDAVVVPSRPMRDALAGYGVTTPMEIIPTGIHLAHFAGGDGGRFRAAHGIESGRPMLLFVGRVAHEKNIAFLLRMTKRLREEVPDVLLVICGEGPAEAPLRREVQASGLAANTLFVGYLDRETALLDCYRAADVFVFASRTETQGLVLLESMACGTPVVALAVMGTRDVLREGEGARIAQDDPEGFAAVVKDVLENAPARAALAARAALYAATWSDMETARRMASFYAAVCDGRLGGLRGLVDAYVNGARSVEA